jgi:hypothetical protein
VSGIQPPSSEGWIEAVRLSYCRRRPDSGSHALINCGAAQWHLRVPTGSRIFHLADSHNNLAVVLLDQGNYAGAEPLVRRSLFITQKRLGPTLFLYPDRQAKVLAAGKKYNVPVGYPSGDPDEINRLVAEGFRFFQASTDLNMMKSAAIEMLGKVPGRKTAPLKPAVGIYGEK